MGFTQVASGPLVAQFLPCRGNVPSRPPGQGGVTWPKKRFVLEFGTGIDLHGEDNTKAACRAVKDAVSRSCLCGLLEIHGIQDLSLPEVEILVALPPAGRG